MLVCAAAADADYDLSAFASSADYIGAIMSRPNENSRRQSAAGLRALLFLLEKAGVDPAPLVLAREKSGRPYFAGSDIKFGISHSGSLAVCALSDSDVGIDIERVRDVRNAAALAERHFSPAELAWAGEMTAEKFFTVWTKKEALLKRDGRGVDCDLRAVDTAAEDFGVYLLRYGGDKYIVSVCGGEDISTAGGIRWERKS